MNNVDIYGLVMLTVFSGGFLTFLGWVMKSQNAGDMLNGFDAKKYDKDKVSKIVGKTFLNSGLLIILVGIIGLFLNSKYYNYVSSVQSAILLIGIAKGMYEMYTKCKIKK